MKKYFYIVLFLTLGWSPVFVELKAQTCPVAFYPFCGNANDVSGNNFNGTVYGATLTENRDGLANHAYELDGSNDYIRISNDSLLDFDVNQDFAISFWIRLPFNQNSSVNPANDIIDMWLDVNSGLGRYPYSIRVYNQSNSNSGKLRLTRKDEKTCDNYMEMNPDTNLNDTLWHHVVMVKNNDSLFSFVDGIPYDTIADSSVCNTTNGYDITFGRRDGSKNPNWLKGVIDDIGFFNCALTWGEVQNLYCSDFTTDSLAICNGDSVYIDTAWRSTAGEYLKFLNNAAGCDSIVCVHLSLIDTVFTAVNDSICMGDSILIGNIYRKNSGTYWEFLTASGGCDSVVSIDLFVKDSYNDTLIESMCKGDSMLIGGIFRKSAGIYVDSNTNRYGCDSIASIDLTVKIVNTNVTQVGALLASQATTAFHQWVDCDDNYQTIPGAINANFQATKSGRYAVLVYQYGCLDTSDCYEVIIPGINENTDSEHVSIYPNPGKDQITLEIDRDISLYDLQILNMQGEVMLERKKIAEKKLHIDLSNFSPGAYSVIGSER